MLILGWRRLDLLEDIRINTGKYYHDGELEEYVVYRNRENIFFIGMLIGVVLLAYALV